MTFIRVAHFFSFAIGIVTVAALSSYENGGIDICPNSNLSELEYADDVVLLSQDSIKLQVFLNHLIDGADIFGVFLSPLKCKMVLHDWNGLKP